MGMEKLDRNNRVPPSFTALPDCFILYSPSLFKYRKAQEGTKPDFGLIYRFLSSSILKLINYHRILENVD